MGKKEKTLAQMRISKESVADALMSLFAYYCMYESKLIYLLPVDNYKQMHIWPPQVAVPEDPRFSAVPNPNRKFIMRAVEEAKLTPAQCRCKHEGCSYENCMEFVIGNYESMETIYCTGLLLHTASEHGDFGSADPDGSTGGVAVDPDAVARFLGMRPGVKYDRPLPRPDVVKAAQQIMAASMLAEEMEKEQGHDQQEEAAPANDSPDGDDIDE
jgi:hypothetical protein